MDTLTEKKWFVYLGDHHEGPFSLEDIQGMMAGGKVSQSSFVWADGMADWKAMTEVDEFRSLSRQGFSVINEPAQTLTEDSSFTVFQPIKGAELESGGLNILDDGGAGQFSASAMDSISNTVLEPAPTLASLAEFTPAQSATATAPEKSKKNEQKEDKPKKSSSKAALFLILLGSVGAFGYAVSQGWVPSLSGSNVSTAINPYLWAAADRFPVLEKWISPIVALPDVSSEEYDALKHAASSSDHGPAIELAIAVSKDHLEQPHFYIAAPLEDETVFNIYVVGVSDTLLNQLSYGMQLTTRLERKLGKTSALRFSDGRAIPRGEYLVYVTASDVQPLKSKAVLAAAQPLQAKMPVEKPEGMPKDAKILAFKTYFLGGLRDATYTQRLGEFHDKIKAKAGTELVEIKQFATTLESQLNSSNTKFDLLKKGKLTAKHRKEWEKFHAQWIQLDGQLNEIFKKWTPEIIQREFFYAGLYQMTLQTGQAIENAHALQNAVFSGTTAAPATSSGTAYDQAASTAVNSIALLKAKVQEAEKLPMTPGGLPRREF